MEYSSLKTHTNKNIEIKNTLFKLYFATNTIVSARKRLVLTTN